MTREREEALERIRERCFPNSLIGELIAVVERETEARVARECVEIAESEFKWEIAHKIRCKYALEGK